MFIHLVAPQKNLFSCLALKYNLTSKRVNNFYRGHERECL
jgi:hypothetical protein